MENWYPLGNEPPIYYDPPSPTESDDGNDEGAGYVPRFDLMFAARSSRRAAGRLARREQRVMEEQQEDPPRVEESQPLGESEETLTLMESIELYISRMPGAYPQSPPSDAEALPPMTEIAKEKTIWNVTEDAATHSRPSQQPPLNPDYLLPKQPPSPKKRKWRSMHPAHFLRSKRPPSPVCREDTPMQPSVRDTPDDGETHSRVTSREKRARMQPAVEDASDDGDASVKTGRAVPPRQLATTSPDPNSSRQSRPPPPIVSQNRVPENIAPPLDRRSMWHDHYLAFDRASEARAREALLKAGYTPERAKCVKRTEGGCGRMETEQRRTDTEHRQTETEHRRTDTEHRQTSPDFEDWDAYLEDVYNADDMEYQHRIQEAKRYGILISRPVVPERRKRLIPKLPAVKQQNTAGRYRYPWCSMEKVIKPLFTLPRRSGRWNTEGLTQRRTKKTAFKPSVVQTTFTPLPLTTHNFSGRWNTEPAPQKEPKQTKKVTFKYPLVETTSTPTPLTAQNLSRHVAAQQSSQPLVKSRRRPSFDSLYNVSTGSSRCSEKQGKMQRPGGNGLVEGSVRDRLLDEVDAEEQEAIMDSLQERRRSVTVANSTGDGAFNGVDADEQEAILESLQGRANNVSYSGSTQPARPEPLYLALPQVGPVDWAEKVDYDTQRALYESYKAGLGGMNLGNSILGAPRLELAVMYRW